VAIIVLVAILIFVVIMAIYLCIKLTLWMTGKKEKIFVEEHVMRNGRMMNAMKVMPYGTFMMREAFDCPICLESFNDESNVVQL